MFPLLLAKTCRRKKTIEWSVVWAAATLMWFCCNDNAAKRDFKSQTAYSEFGMDILMRSGIIYCKWPNLKRESLDASMIWFWTNSQGTGDEDVMTHMCVAVMPMLQNAISQTAESHLGMNNLRSGIIYHKQLNVVFIQLFGNKWFMVNSMLLKWFAQHFEHIVICITLLLILRILLRFRYQWPKDPMNDKSATVSQSQGRHKHPDLSNHRQFECLFSYH